MKIFELSLILTIALAAAASTGAQTKASSPIVSEQRVVRFAKRIRAHALAERLPKNVRVEAWLKSLAGAGAVLTWEMNDCGDQTGELGDGSNTSARLCAELDARLANGKLVGFQIQVGTFKKGIYGKPEIVFIYIMDEKKSEYPANLYELEARLKEMRLPKS